jgi:hypothetical protein
VRYKFSSTQKEGDAMKNNRISGYIGAFVLSAVLSTPILADSRGGHDRDDDDEDGRNAHSVKAELTSYQEVPSISSPCEGEFRATISNDNSQIAFELSYAKLEGAVAQAHIHFAQKGVNGGISVFLCSNLNNGPAGTPSCPGPNSGTVSGTRQAANVIAGAVAQGIAAGELTELIEAIQAGKAYANVHSDKFPGGECRGQIR